jgi:2-isopropylmalate synthase
MTFEVKPGMNDAFHVFDTTLRDGAQGEGMALTVADKLAIAQHLDDLGVGFIEGGWPGALLKHAQLVAFGATRKAGVKAAEDPQVAGLLAAETPVVCLVAKSHVGHVERALRTTREENLAMIADTVQYLRSQGRRVFVDCEHFFDGYLTARDYSLEVVRTAAEAGASVVVLCDTNGGMLPSQVGRAVADILAETGARLGIHCQDDTGCAVANTIAAVEAGVTHVQCVANGYGERTGNANLATVLGNLELKIAEISNMAPRHHLPYVGMSAFAHKAGLHASAIKVDPDLYQHIDPTLVGNDMRMLISEMAGRSSVELKGNELGHNLAADPEALGRVVERVKNLEARGYSFEAADASFDLLIREELTVGGIAQFELESWRVIVDRDATGGVRTEATVKLHAAGERIVATGEGNGPVNALDTALRQALGKAYPNLVDLELVDYKVRIIEGSHGTGAVVRVLVETSDGVREWDTVGVHENIIEASWQALSDAVTYGLLGR